MAKVLILVFAIAYIIALTTYNELPDKHVQAFIVAIITTIILGAIVGALSLFDR